MSFCGYSEYFVTLFLLFSVIFSDLYVLLGIWIFNASMWYAAKQLYRPDFLQFS